MTHKKEIVFSTFRYLCLVALLALGLITIVGSGNDTVTTTSGGGETTTYNAAEAIGDLAEITFNPTTLEYSYTVIEGIHEGQTDSGTLSLMTGYTDYVYETEDGVPVIVFPGNVFLMIPGGGQEGLTVGVPSLATDYTVADIVGVYNFVALVGVEGQTIAEYDGTMGTFKVNADGTWEAWQEGDLTTLLDLSGYEKISGTWEDQGNGVIYARSGDPEVKFANIMIHPGYAENPDEKVLIVDINDESEAAYRGIMLGVKQKAITPGSGDGDYSLLESDEGSIIPITVSGNNVIHPEGTSPITYNFPWDGFVVGSDNTLELVLPGGIFFGGGGEEELGDVWIFAGIKTGGGGAGASSPAINTAGGNGGSDDGFGGGGGNVRIYMSSFDDGGGSMGSIEVLGSGVADASFTPTDAEPDLGIHPVYIDGVKTIPLLDPEAPFVDPGADEPYMVIGDWFIYISDGNENPLDDVIATGLSVAAGATLTLNLNDPTACVLEFTDDVENSGTIKTADADPLQRGHLVFLSLNSYHGNGTIDTSGTQDGQHGGDVWIEPDDSFFNSGDIDTSGADSTTGDAGNGGGMYVSADNGIENTGNITADGGTSSAAGSLGGLGGNLELQAAYGIQNSGNLSCRGGNGVVEEGSGGDIYFEVWEAGNLRNSGHLDTSGGDATAGDGGPGGSIEMYAYGGDIINSGNLTTKGGNATELWSNGGPGGLIYVSVEYGFLLEEVPAGDILFSGNIDTSGGLAVVIGPGSGGLGGDFEIGANYDGFPSGQRIALLGYASIDASGGKARYGGNGASVELFCDPGYDDGTGDYTPGCNITNEIAINATGGSAVAGATTPAYGGPGGDVVIYTAEQFDLLDPDMDKVTNSGTINTSSGNSLESDGEFVASAGSVDIWGYNGVTNTGNITARGGDDLGTDGGSTGYGGYGNGVQLLGEEGLVSNSGDIGTDGGYGEYEGGTAGLFNSIVFDGAEVSNSGALTANGGDADPDLDGSSGGDGWDVLLDSPAGMAGITQTGTVSNHGGAGQDPGSDGDYYLAGVLQ